MKKSVLLSSWAAVFAAGYWAHHWMHPADSVDQTGRQVRSRESAKGVTGESKGEARTGKAADVRAFTPGRPFPPGGAKAWLMAMAGGFAGDKRSDALAMVDAAQAFITMDEDAARETAEAINELVKLLAQGDPLIKSMRDADDMLEGAQLLTMIRLAQTNPEAAFAMIKAHPESTDGEAMLFVMGRIASKDPAKAEAMALTLPEKQRNDALKSVIAALGVESPAAALEFAGKYPEAMDSHEQRRILEKWAQREPLRAMPEAVKFMEKTKDPEMLRQPFEEWYKLDAAAASAWAATQQGDARITIQALMLQRRAAENPQAAVAAYATLQTETSDPRHLQKLAGTIATTLAAQDVGAARDWAMTLPSGEPKDAAVYQIAEQWVKVDAPAASEWIRTLPPGNSRDSATVRLINNIRRREPASALEWAQSMQNEQQREQQTRQVLNDWQEQDPEAAQAARAALLEAAKPQ